MARLIGCVTRPSLFPGTACLFVPIMVLVLSVQLFGVQ